MRAHPSSVCPPDQACSRVPPIKQKKRKYKNYFWVLESCLANATLLLSPLVSYSNEEVLSLLLLVSPLRWYNLGPQLIREQDDKEDIWHKKLHSFFKSMAGRLARRGDERRGRKKKIGKIEKLNCVLSFWGRTIMKRTYFFFSFFSLLSWLLLEKRALGWSR